MNDLSASDGWADLCGPAIKSAITRAAAKFFDSLCQEYLNTGSDRDRVLSALASGLVEFYDILYSSPMIVPPPNVANFSAVSLNFGENYQRLREIARIAGDLVAPVRTKAHKQQHLPKYCEV